MTCLIMWQVNLVTCLMTVMITNIASNTATANVLVPILAEMSLTLCTNPIYLTLPAGTPPFPLPPPPPTSANGRVLPLFQKTVL